MLSFVKRATTFAAMATVVSAGPAMAQDGELTIGVSVANLQADFFNQIKQSVEEKAGKMDGVNVITVDARGDSATQVSQVQDLITREIDALIYIPAGATAASVPVEAAHAEDIPVVAVDRNPEDAPGDTFIATDSVEAADTLGAWVGWKTGGEGKIGVIRGQIGTTPEIARAKGFQQAIDQYDGLEIVARQASEMWMQDEGFNITQDMIQRNPGINVFFGRADALAMGAAQAVKVANLDHEPVIVGFDGDFAGLEAVRDGVLDATMTQQTQRMGGLALESAIKLANGEDVPAEQLQKAFLTTAPEQAQEYLENHP